MTPRQILDRGADAIFDAISSDGRTTVSAETQRQRWEEARQGLLALDLTTVYVVEHHGDYDEGSVVLGVFGTPGAADGAQHRKMRARNKDGTVSFRTNDPRPKVPTLDGCDTITPFILNAGES